MAHSARVCPAPAGKAAAAHLRPPCPTQARSSSSGKRSARQGLPRTPVTTAGSTNTSNGPPVKKIQVSATPTG
ncbi:hypothetical protein NDU88_002602 [Pleurodeles waltl]|uniref:Uncharacterized protein n=1 Tax=Pleurodeles waltl TaxID=8319 RepID=A0AAV7SF41_PLEWA|nr:hypothetical protein NDU88_002602 [Pleurodeles waltl]